MPAQTRTPSISAAPPSARASMGSHSTNPTPAQTRRSPDSDQRFVCAGFDSRAIIATVAVWEDIMETKRSIDLRCQAIIRAGVEPPKQFQLIYLHLKDAERECKTLIRREWRKHPLAPWCSEVLGLGEHSAAVMIAYLDGDVIQATPRRWEGNALVEGEPFERTISQLRSYCGYGNAERKRRVGMSQEDTLALGKPLLKARLRLIAEGFIKAGNPVYRAVYDARRADTESRDWTKGHAHADALRIVVKRFLKDLWLAARATAEAGASLQASARAEVLA